MLATDLDRGDELVAVKELLPSRMKRWKDYELFHRECQTLQTLQHPGIPRYHEHFTIDPPPDVEKGVSRLFLVQEYVDGKSVEEALAEGETMPEEEVRAIARAVLEVLDYLHGLNPPVIHRDIKPSNLMFTADGKLKLIDFGAVREAVTADGVGSTIVGTFGYMPPEQYAGKSTPATDLFALGATCVELVSGRPPGELFSGIHEFNLPDDLPVTLGFEQFLLRMTEPEVAERFQTARDALEALDQQFLMVPKAELTGNLPIPHQIRPAPRPYPGFYLRDAYTGLSHLAVIVLCVVAVLMSLVAPIAMLASGKPVFSILGFFGTAVTITMAAMVSAKPRNEISVYRRGTYALGEVTGRFVSTASTIETHLTYRYLTDDGWRHGCIATNDKGYRSLTPGDPVGVIYLPDEPEEHVMYAVPAEWSKKQAVGITHRLESRA